MTHHPGVEDLANLIRQLAPPCTDRDVRASCPGVCAESKTSATVCQEIRNKRLKYRNKNQDMTSGGSCSDAGDAQRQVYLIGNHPENPEYIVTCYEPPTGKTCVRNVLNQAVNRNYEQPPVKHETCGVPDKDGGRDPNFNVLLQKVKPWQAHHKEGMLYSHPAKAKGPGDEEDDCNKHCHDCTVEVETRLPNLSGNLIWPTYCQLRTHPINAISQMVRPCCNIPPPLGSGTFEHPHSGRDACINVLRQKVHHWRRTGPELALMSMSGQRVRPVCCKGPAVNVEKARFYGNAA